LHSGNVHDRVLHSHDPPWQITPSTLSNKL
jgi:hypothetical protein